MAQTLLKVSANFQTQLSSPTAVGATSMVLSSVTDADGTALPSGTYGFTIDEGTSTEEHCTGVLTTTNTTIASLNHVTRTLTTASSGLNVAHRRGAIVKITDHPALRRVINILDGTTDLDASTPLEYDGTATINANNQLATKAYVDGVAIAGAADSSTSVKGIGRVSVAPASASIPIFVGDNDPRVPTADENNALVGNNTDIAVGTGNKFVTQTGLQKGAEVYAADAGASDTYAITLSPVPTGYAAGMKVSFKANTANTGAATLNVNSLGAVTIKKAYNTDLATGDILANQIVEVIHDGTNFQMLSQPGTQPVSSFVGDYFTSTAGTSSTQNVDTSYTTTFTPKVITLNYYIRGTTGSGSVAVRTGIAIWDGTTFKANWTTTTSGDWPSGGSSTAPTIGDGGTNDQTALSITSVSATGFTVRVAFVRGSTWNGQCLASYTVTATA